MKKSKNIHLLILILFVYFAYVQFNDTDGLKWILIYSSISVLAVSKLLDYHSLNLARIISAVLGIYLLVNINLLSSWLAAGKPAFIDYEPTFIQEVENIREFMGLVISFFVALTYIFIFNKK